MIDLSKLTPFARKTWAIKKFRDWEEARNTKALRRARLVYFQPADKVFEDNLDRSKWKATIDRKVNYLLARPPVSKMAQAELDKLLGFIKESAREFMLRGSLIWLVQGDGVDLVKKPFIMNDTCAIYQDETQKDIVCYIHKYTDIEIARETGAETEVVYYELYWGSKKETFCESMPDNDKSENLAEEPLFIELGKTGDAPLYAYIVGLLFAYNHTLCHQDRATEKNIDPTVEVRGYVGSDTDDLDYAVNVAKIVKTEGQGGLAIHMRSMDSASIDTWQKRLLQEWYEATATVGKENELQYAVSGKALDRLFIDMENSARELAGILEDALKEYFQSIGIEIDIVWNTDRPVDDAATISAISASRGLLSDETLIEQHPWVNDIQLELERLEKQNFSGMGDLLEPKPGETGEFEIE